MEETSVTPVEIDPDAKLRDLVTHPSIVLVLGKRGSGKPALAYRILELCKNQGTPYVVGIPANAADRLPDWIGVAETLRTCHRDPWW